jgi:hypothetical protein
LQQNNMRYPQRPIRPITPLAPAAADQQQQQLQHKQKQRPASTGRMGLKRWPDRQQQQQREQQQEQHSAALRAAAAAAAVLGEEAGRQLMDHMLRNSRRTPAATGLMSATVGTGRTSQKAQQKQQQQHDDIHESAGDADGFTFDSPNKTTSSSKKASSGSPQRQASPPKVPAAARRLYEDAFVKRERQAQLQEVTQATERKARSWSAPRWAAWAGLSAFFSLQNYDLACC